MSEETYFGCSFQIAGRHDREALRVRVAGVERHDYWLFHSVDERPRSLIYFDALSKTEAQDVSVVAVDTSRATMSLEIGEEHPDNEKSDSR